MKVPISHSPSGSDHWTDKVLRSATYQLTWLTTRSTARARAKVPVQPPGRSLAVATIPPHTSATAASETKYSAEKIFICPVAKQDYMHGTDQQHLRAVRVGTPVRSDPAGPATNRPPHHPRREPNTCRVQFGRLGRTRHNGPVMKPRDWRPARRPGLSRPRRTRTKGSNSAVLTNGLPTFHAGCYTAHALKPHWNLALSAPSWSFQARIRAC